MVVVFCQITYDEDAEGTKKCVEAIRPFVDRVIIIEDCTLSEEARKFLLDAKCEVYSHMWKDNLAEKRNHYLERLNDGDWAVISDPDESYDEVLCREIKEVIERAENAGVNQIHLNCHDCWVKEDGSIQENVSDHYKPLIFKYKKGVHYRGIIHEMLVGQEWTARKASQKYFYRHIKTTQQVWLRAMRNSYCSGGGDNFIGNPYWLELKQITSSLGIDRWRRLFDYLKKGNIDPRLKEWIIKYRNLDKESWHSEIREWYLGYFRVLHPEEEPPELREDIKAEHWGLGPPVIPKGGLAEFIIGLNEVYKKTLGRLPSKCEIDYWWGKTKSLPDFTIKEIEYILEDEERWQQNIEVYVAQMYYEVLEREVDPSGFYTYVTLIQNGSLRKEDLVTALKSSQEYRSKHPEERVVGIDYVEKGLEGKDVLKRTIVQESDIMNFVSEVFRMCSLMLQGRVSSFTISLQLKEEEKKDGEIQ